MSKQPCQLITYPFSPYKIKVVSSMFWHLWPIQKYSFLFIFTESNFSSFYERMIMMGLEFLFRIIFFPKSSSYNYRMFWFLVFWVFFSPSPFPHMTPSKTYFCISFLWQCQYCTVFLASIFSVMSLVMSKNPNSWKILLESLRGCVSGFCVRWRYSVESPAEHLTNCFTEMK